MTTLNRLAILTLEGELKDVMQRGEHSCLVLSLDPITRDLLEAVQMEIGATFSLGSKEDLEARHANPSGFVEAILQKHGLRIIDVANISAAKIGGVWINEMGYDYHIKKLRRLQF